jgi:hypothetical protein
MIAIATTRALVAAALRRQATAAAVVTAETARPVAEPAPAARIGQPLQTTVLPMAPFVAQLIATHRSLPIPSHAAAADATLAYRKASGMLVRV